MAIELCMFWQGSETRITVQMIYNRKRHKDSVVDGCRRLVRNRHQCFLHSAMVYEKYWRKVNGNQRLIALLFQESATNTTQPV